MFSRLLFAFTVGALVATLASADDTVTARRFPLPQMGELELTMPYSWKDQLRQPPQGLPPTISLTPATGNSFQVLITPKWEVRPGVFVPSKKEIRNQVQGAADRAKSRAVETTINLRELVGASGGGYYFSATDRAPNPGEFKYMTQGALRVGEIALMFTVLTNDGAESVFPESLAMLRSAKHVTRNAP
jgi:hypothetical protein